MVTKSRDLQLMEHADGEREVPLGPDERAKADVIAELGELVRGRLELAADDVPDQRFTAMWRAIDQNIETAVPVRDGFWRRASRFFETYRSHIITGVVSAGAVAALALVLRGGSGDSGRSSGDHDPINARPVAHRPAEIESLDTPGGTGTVFHLDDPDDKDGSTTVIWVTPEDTVEGI